MIIVKFFYMKPHKKYLQIMRRKTPEERLVIGLGWSAFARDLARQSIKSDNLSLSKSELEKKLQERLVLTKYLDKYGPSLCP